MRHKINLYIKIIFVNQLEINHTDKKNIEKRIPQRKKLKY